jgi:hypothetical protein
MSTWKELKDQLNNVEVTKKVLGKKRLPVHQR